MVTFSCTIFSSHSDPSNPDGRPGGPRSPWRRLPCKSESSHVRRARDMQARGRARSGLWFAHHVATRWQGQRVQSVTLPPGANTAGPVAQRHNIANTISSVTGKFVSNYILLAFLLIEEEICWKEKTH